MQTNAPTPPQLTKSFAGFADGLDVGYDIELLVGHDGGLRKHHSDYIRVGPVKFRGVHDSYAGAAGRWGRGGLAYYTTALSEEFRARSL